MGEEIGCDVTYRETISVSRTHHTQTDTHRHTYSNTHPYIEPHPEKHTHKHSHTNTHAEKHTHPEIHTDSADGLKRTKKKAQYETQYVTT